MATKSEVASEEPLISQGFPLQKFFAIPVENTKLGGNAEKVCLFHELLKALTAWAFGSGLYATWGFNWKLYLFPGSFVSKILFPWPHCQFPLFHGNNLSDHTRRCFC